MMSPRPVPEDGGGSSPHFRSFGCTFSLHLPDPSIHPIYNYAKTLEGQAALKYTGGAFYNKWWHNSFILYFVGKGPQIMWTSNYISRVFCCCPSSTVWSIIWSEGPRLEKGRWAYCNGGIFLLLVSRMGHGIIFSILCPLLLNLLFFHYYIG
ncbi:hypothetical protein EV2_041753 [Malus domestica]